MNVRNSPHHPTGRSWPNASFHFLKRESKFRHRFRQWVRGFGYLLVFPLILAIGPQATPPNADQVVALRQGERMYREGILPSGKPMNAAASGNSPVAGVTYACASCHLQAGLGSEEGGVVTPPTNAEKLFRPWFRYHPALVGEERKDLPEQIRHVLRRPAYTDAELARAITQGVDPTGRTFNQVMPRYPLSPADADILVRYLKQLSATPSPGVNSTTLSFATVITDEVSAEDRQDFLEVLSYRFDIHNRQGANRETRGYRSLAAKEGALAFREWSLSVWELKGPASGWPAQLEAHYRRNPVFALVSGLSSRPWAPIHAFCEAHQLPCILPLADLPQLESSGGYTLYFSKGPFQEGEAAAAFLSGQGEASTRRPVLQVVADTPAARAVAKGFISGWSERGHGPVQTVQLRKGEQPQVQRLANAFKGKGDPILLLWTGKEAFPNLAAYTRNPKAMVMMSTSLLEQHLWKLPQAARDRTWLTYPFRLFRPPTSMKAPEGTSPESLAKVSLVAGDTHRRVRSRAFVAMKALAEAVTRMERNFYRDNLLDAFTRMMDDDESDYERLSFGPGQRHLSRGCYVVRMPKGSLHGFMKESDWVIH